jgi:alcohol dehydrogenase
VAVAFNPLGAGIRWAVTVPGTRPGDVVACARLRHPGACRPRQPPRAAGAAFVMVTGAGPHDHARLAEAARFGADLAVDVLERIRWPALRAAAGVRGRRRGGRHGQGPRRRSRRASRWRGAGGTMVVAGTRGGGGTPGFDPDHVVYKELRLQGALGVDTSDYRAALDLLARGTYPFADLPRVTSGWTARPSCWRRWPASAASRRSTPCSSR